VRVECSHDARILFAVFVEHDFIHPGPLGLRLRQDEKEVGTFMGHKEHVVRVKEVNNPELKGKIRPDMLLYAVNKATLVGLTIEEAMYQIGEEKKRCLSSGETMTLKLRLTDATRVRTDERGQGNGETINEVRAIAPCGRMSPGGDIGS